MATTARKARTSRARRPVAKRGISRRIGALRAALWTLAFGERVAGAAQRQDEGRVGRIVLELLAQVADVDVDRFLVLVEGLVVAHELEQLTPREDAARLRRQVAQDLELGCREADPAVAALDAAPLEIDQQV